MSNSTNSALANGARVSMAGDNGVRFFGTVTDDAHVARGVIYVAWDGARVRKENVCNVAPA